MARSSSEVDSLRTSASFLEEEFLAGEYPIEIQPSFNSGEPLRLISEECGPFDRRSTISVPLWIALYLERHGKCTIKTPAWLSPSVLRQKLREEREAGAGSFASLSDHLIQVAFMLLNREYLATDYLGGHLARNQLETVLTELLLLRRAKITEGLKQVDFTTTVVGITNMTSIERECIRPQTSLILDSLRDLWTIRDDVMGGETRGM
jgi:GINS complex subunit 2